METPLKLKILNKTIQRSRFMVRKYKSWKVGAAVLAGLALGACASPGVVADIPDADAPAYVVQAAPEDFPSDTVPSEPTPASILPSLDSLAVNGIDLSVEGDVFTFPVEVSPGDRLEIEADVNDDVDGTIRALTTVRPYKGDTGEVKFSLTIPSDLSSVDIPLILEGEDGESVEYTLRIDPGSEWAPTIVIENPTGLTGDVSLEVRLVDLNGTDTAQIIGIEQEFNFQDTGNKEIEEYISNNSLAPIEIEQTESGLYVVTFSTEWPGRFPLNFTAVDDDGNETVSRVPIEVYWAEQPFSMRGIGTGWQVPGDANYYNEYFETLKENNINLVQILIAGYMPTLTSSEISDCDYQWTPESPCTGGSPSAVADMIRTANEHNIEVMLVPQLVVGNWEPKWRMAPNWNSWFSLKEGDQSYATWILKWAEFSEKNGVDHFSVGSELVRTHTQGEHWRRLVSAVKETYSGEISYGDNYPIFFNNGGGVPFPACEDLDLYGIQFYYPGTGGRVGTRSNIDPTLGEMYENLSLQVEKLFLPEYERHCKGIPVFISEMSILPFDGSNANPEEFLGTFEERDFQEQAEWIDAVLRVAKDYGFVGVVPWQLQPQRNPWVQHENLPGDLRNLPALDTLRIHYSSPNSQSTSQSTE